MGWTPLPDDAPLDHEALPPPDRMQEPADAAPAGFAPLPDDVQLDAPDDQAPPDGFTDEQKQQIISFLPKAKDAADLEKFASELSGGKHSIGNAEKVVDYVKKGGDPSAFAWAPVKAAASADAPHTVDDLRSHIGEGIIDAIDTFVPGAGDLIRANRGAGKAFTEHVANAAAFDYGPEVGAVIDTILHGGGIDNNAAHERAIIEGDSEDHPIASTAGELAGIGLTAPLTAEATGLAKMGKLAKVGVTAAEGAAFGSGAAGPGERAPGAAIGAVAAPVIGAVARGVAAIPSAVRQGAKTVLEGSPGLARRIIARAIKDDANTPETVANDIGAAHANDVPMALADTGENTRGLLAAASRASGMARTVARDALEERQQGLAERVTDAIQRDLGPVANPHELADNLMTKARDEAAPLYEQAYAKPGAESFAKSVSPLLQRPSMKKALAYAYRVAQEEGRDPEALGFATAKDRTTSILDANGNHITVPEVEMTTAPSWQTLDYVKRGADDLVESYKNKVTGKYNFDTEGNAANNTLRSYLKAFDGANPTYAEARAAYGGPVSGISAMNMGRKALSKTGDDIEAAMRDMTPFEKQMYALGIRRAMAETVQSKGDTADVVNAIVGTGKKRAMLARAFGDRKAFQRFVDTLGQEREGFRTFKQALLGSPTAANLQDDAAIQTGALAADLMLSGGLPVATATSKAIKFLGVKVGKKAQEDIAALLSNTDPAAIRKLAAELRAKAQNRGIKVPRAIESTTGKGAAVLIPSEQRQ